MMNPYQRFRREDLILRDELAIDRTMLANERTLLAYLRSGMALFLAGVTFIQFAEDQWFAVLGIMCLPAGLITLIFGTWRFRNMRSKILAARQLAVQNAPSVGDQSPSAS